MEHTKSDRAIYAGRFATNLDLQKRICSKSEIIYAMHRERSRTDRTQLPFSMISIRTNGTPEDCNSDALAAWLCERTRITDDVGLIDDGSVIVLLSATDSIGARVVADEIQSLYGESICSVELYEYPSNWPADDLVRHDCVDDGSCRPLGPIFEKRLPMWKRLVDIVVSLGGLFALSPLFLIVTIAIKLTSNGPALFSQQRSGIGGRPFRIFKFRTMRANAESYRQELSHLSQQDGPAFKLLDDPRTTSLGKVLRKTSVDELPQLWNVLRGDMTLIGPRPLPCFETSACENWQHERLHVTPGLSCSWQLSGRSTVSFAHWMRMDIQYVRNRSFGSDVRLLVKTIYVVLFRPNGV